MTFKIHFENIIKTNVFIQSLVVKLKKKYKILRICAEIIILVGIFLSTGFKIHTNLNEKKTS